MTLSGAFVFTKLSTNHPVMLNMGECILISVTAVLQEVPRLPAAVELPHLDVPVHGGEGCLTIK